MKLIIINVSWASGHHIRVICEGSCDTEEQINPALVSRKDYTKHFKSYRAET